MTASILARVELAPGDPILGVTEAYNADQNPKKVNLGVGVYYDDQGKVPVLECVRRVERDMLETVTPKGYLPIDGIPAYDRAVQQLAFGADSAVVKEGRAVTVQGLGGTGALKIAADFLRRVSPGAQVWISDPSWENHRALFEGAGFTVNAYPYYDAATHGLDFSGMTGALEKLAPGAIVVLHACCHNPTGVDLTRDQWTRVLEIVKTRELVPILDIAYQGFAEGVDADGEVVRRFAQAMSPVFVANSFSKSFSLYGERVGGLSVATASARRGETRAEPAEARRARQLLQSADVRRQGGGDRAEYAGTTGVVGSRARADARADQGDAARACREGRGAGAGIRARLRDAAARDVLVLGPLEGAGSSAPQGVLRLRHR